MVIRIVKMTFREDAVEDFLSMFHGVKEKIRAAEGCTHLALLRVQNHPSQFMTYSYWESEEFLEQYRTSELFKTTWAQTKTYFAERPEAWSLTREVVLN